ncbi:MAG: transcriptional repressor [Candidatus Woesearchaeota archaeon]
MKNTIQKIKVLEYLKKNKNHPTAEKIYEDVKKEIPSITIATVYRILNKLVKEQEIVKIQVNNTSFYDYIEEKHVHFICTNCNKIIDIYEKNLCEVLDSYLNTNKNYFSYSLLFFGLCDDCKYRSR